MSKKKVVAIVTPLYFVTKVLVDTYTEYVGNGYDVHFIVTDSDIPFYDSLSRVSALSVTLMESVLSTFTVGTNGSTPSNMKESIELEAKRIAHDVYNDEIDWESIEVITAVPRSKESKSWDYSGSLSDFDGLESLNDIEAIAHKLHPRFASRYLPVLLDKLSRKLNDLPTVEYGVIPFFKYGEGKNAYRVAILQKQYGVFPSLGPISVPKVNGEQTSATLFVNVLADATGAERVGNPFIETLTIPGSNGYSSVVFQEIDMSTTWQEMYESNSILMHPTDNTVDLVAIPEGRLFANGQVTCWIKLALDNPSEQGNA